MIIQPSIFTNPNTRSLQTTRKGGQSLKPYDSLNFGIFGQDQQVSNNIKQFSLSQKLPHELIFLEQIHSNKVVEYKQQPHQHGFEKADACITRVPNVVCTILTADCLPVLITDINSTVVAAIHCGWRGLYSEILKATIDKMAVNGKDLLCWLGPCISYKPYRVDKDFRDKFVNKNPQLAHSFYRNSKGGWHADLKKIAVTQLESLGVKSILQSPYCTFDNKNLFYSYRRDGETGRMASMIWINDNTQILT